MLANDATHKAQRKTDDPALMSRRTQSSWRRRSYLIGSAALSLIWLGIFLLTSDVTGSHTFEYSQTNCEDPLGTQMLFVASVAFLALLLIVCTLLGLNFYNDKLPHT
jgi:hypothetical protein